MVASILTFACRWSFRLALALALVVALFSVATRWWLFPQIDQFRPWVVSQLSAALDMDVDMGRLQARWHRWHLAFQVEDVVLRDRRGRHMLALPEAGAVLSWRSLLAGQPHLTGLRLEGLTLTIQRDAKNRVKVLGQTVPVASRILQALPLHSPGVQWLLQQPHVHIIDSEVRWQDGARLAPPMVWSDVTLSMQNQGVQHKFGLQAQTAAGSGAKLDLRGRLVRRPSPSRSPPRLDGELYARLDGLRPETWTQWISWPAHIEANHVSAQAWVNVTNNHFGEVLADIKMDQGHWDQTGGFQVRVEQGRAQLQFPFAQLPALEGLTGQLQMKNAHLSVASQPDMPFFAQAFTARAAILRDDLGVSLTINDMMLDSPDAQATGSLHWTNREQDARGYMDMELDIHHARMAAIPQYVPAQVDEDVRAWLHTALHEGVVKQGRVALHGPLTAFPFDAPGVGGSLTVKAPFQGASLDYFPAVSGEPGWPALRDMQGEVLINGASMEIHARRARLSPGTSGHIELQQLQARIPHMRYQPRVQVQGKTYADAPVYLELLRVSPLSAQLDHIFDDARARGRWAVPLALDIPLQADAAVQVDGRLQMQDTALQLNAAWPGFEQLQAELLFTQDSVTLSEWTGQFLDAPAVLSGGVGPGQPGLTLEGRAGAAALAELAGVPGAQRLSGATAYSATLTGMGPGAGGRPQLKVHSDLEGMAMDFPIPLGKAADQSMPVVIHWQYGDRPGDRILEIDFSQRLKARFSHASQVDGSAWFQAGTISAGDKAQWPEQGLSVAISQPEFDVDAWDDITREFAPPAGDDDKGANARLPLFPQVRYLQLEAGQARLLGMDLSNLTYRFWQDGAMDWRADIRSNEAVGQLAWTEIDGKVTGPVHATFDRLKIGNKEKTENEPADGTLHDDVTVPAVSLQVNALEFYGMQLGALTLDGVPDATGHVWELEELTLKAPGMELSGEGQWRLQGADRGLSLEVDARTSDIGAYLDQIGFEQTMDQGQGTLSASIRWQDLPWRLDETRLDGEIHFSMHDGRLNTVHSDTARLLELVSYQSMQRLTRLDINPLDLTRDGFPFDVLRGTLHLEQGRLRTNDYQVAGPVGSIVVDGDVALDTGALDLDAVVVPNLDVSGAAIAAGVVVNPIVGLGAFLTQWVLKDPLAHALAVRYRIGGTWKQPHVEAQKKLTRDQPDPVTP